MYQEIQKNDEKLATWYYHKCPTCKVNVHPDRKYCKCGHDVSNIEIYEKEAKVSPAMLGRVNVDMPKLTCDSCGGNCDICYSHGHAGSTECKYKNDSLKCNCCQIFIRNAAGLPWYEMHKTLTGSIKEIWDMVWQKKMRRTA